jgi:hypothetical protein
MKIPHILTENSLTVVIEGKAHTMNVNHPAWNQALEALKADDGVRLVDLFDVEKAVADYFDEEAGITVEDGGVRYGDEVVHNMVVDKILNFMRNGLPYQPLVKFLGKLMENPSSRAVNELYTFLEHKNMPITPEGNFLAYKGVNEDFTDKYSGKFDNSVGQTLEMRRNGVCDDANIGCSHGFHAGSYEYAKGWAGSDGGHLMIVEIDPSDVVSVPLCSDCQKLRTSKYKVVGLYETVDAPPLDEGLNDDYYDSSEEVDDYNEGWYAGFKAAKEERED